MQYLSFVSYPSWMLSSFTSSNMELIQPTCSKSILADNISCKNDCGLAPQPPMQLSFPCPSANANAKAQSSSDSPINYTLLVAPTAQVNNQTITRDPPQPLDDSHSNSRVVRTRVALPVPFSDQAVANRVEFSSHGRPGISLGDWAKLAEKRTTYLKLDDPYESVDELFSEDSQVLLQSHWPGYKSKTCYLSLPAHVTACEKAFTKVDLLDMVCQSLVDWVLQITNCKHIECGEPYWAIGLKHITFKHIYVTSVVEVKGYVSKWIPIIEIDSQAFQSRPQL